MYTIRLVTDWQVVFVLEFEEEEIEVAKCVKTNSGKWHILSATASESVKENYDSPRDALDAYKSYIQTESEEG